jgi:type VI secretion system protein ImpC
VKITAKDPEKTLMGELLDSCTLLSAEKNGREIREGLTYLLKNLGENTTIYLPFLDELIAEIDRILSRQLDVILHSPPFMKMERNWRSLKFLVDRSNFHENIKIRILNIKKEELFYDFDDAPDIISSEIYRKTYTAEYGQYGGQPFGIIIGAYEFDANQRDIKLLQYASNLGAMAHAPFISSVGASFFGLYRWADLANIRDLAGQLGLPQYAAWHNLRQNENSRYLALTLPGFLARRPYSQETNPVTAFNYNETALDAGTDFCWGNTAFVLASKMADSFAKYRWCANIIGPLGGGLVEDLPTLPYESMGPVQNRISTQVLISERREFELAGAGFISLAIRQGLGNAAFFSASTVLKPKTFSQGEGGQEATLNYRISTQLPYMMIINRLAHYIKVLQRENIGTWKDCETLTIELNKWINQYVTDMDNPAPAIRSKRPLHFARVEVYDVEGAPGWHQMNLKIRPHFKYMGASFTLSLLGKLDDLELLRS